MDFFGEYPGRKIFGLNKTKKILPKLFWKYLHPDDLDWMKNSWLQAEREMEPYRGIFRIKLKDGTIKHLSEQAEFMQDTQGNLFKTVGNPFVVSSNDYDAINWTPVACNLFVKRRRPYRFLLHA